jgi:hypothetical protein
MSEGIQDGLFAVMTPPLKLESLAIILLQNIPLTRDQPHAPAEILGPGGEVSGGRKSFS